MNVHVETIEYNSEAYREALRLRYRVLREPLGLTYTPQQLAAESRDTHIVAVADGKIVGNLVLTPLEVGVIQMRQVAVDCDYQGQGIGRALVTFAEQVAKQQDARTLMLHGRVAVQSFYERLGYVAHGEPFEEVTLPHIEMRKTLGGESTTGNTGNTE